MIRLTSDANDKIKINIEWYYDENLSEKAASTLLVFV
jgi:hypothetical protein